MKKILVVLSCAALLLPLVALSCFADTSSFYLVYPAGNILNAQNVTVDSITYTVYNEPVFVSAPSNSTLTVKSLQALSYNGVAVSSDPDFPTFIPFGDTVTVESSFVSTDFYIVVGSFDPFSPVNDGVGSSISFSGQVLSFLTSNSTTIVLIGLSVAMFAILPFAIRKIKQLIKGY